MQRVLLVLAILLISSCSEFMANHISSERQELYDYNNNQEFCQQYPDRCYKNIPRF